MTMAFAVASTVACANKDRGKSNVANRYAPRGTAWQNQMNNPTTGQVSEWGEITGSFSQGLIQSFMPNSDVGYVSGKSNDTTGIRFRGSVKSGEIYIMVYDSLASQNGGQAFYWPMQVVNQQISNNSATVTVQDNVGTVTFRGNINSFGDWSGSVTFTNNGSGQQTLGNFIITAYSILN